MNLLNCIKNIFKYEEKEKYNFTLSSNYSSSTNPIPDKDIKVFSSINKNYEYLKYKFNTLISSDIIFRKFKIIAKNKTYNSFLIYIDGLSNAQMISDFIIKPLINKNYLSNSDTSFNIYDEEINFNLSDYMINNLIPDNDVEVKNDFSDIISDINSGNCLLFVDSLNVAFDFDVKSYKERGITTPQTETIIYGPQEGFVENLRTNTSLLRRSVNNENLVIENINVGTLSKTKCAICYIKDIANDDLVGEVKYRISNLEIDSLLSSGQLEQLIEGNNFMGIPKILSTERPDKCTKALYEGRVIIIINGNPYSLIMPSTFIDYMSSPEDTNIKPQFSNFLKTIRIVALFITLLLPSLWIAVTAFHQELIPTELLYSIVSSREKVPFPIIIEVLLMEIAFELIRESSLRIPSPIGSTIGIVGTLVLGESAVSANIVSPILIIVIAITGITSFAIPDFSFGFHIRITRFIFIILAYVAGLLGIGVGIFLYLTILCSIRSLGVPYMVPFSPVTNFNGKAYFVPSFYKQEKRPDYLNTKRPISQKHISMKWKQNN